MLGARLPLHAGAGRSGGTRSGASRPATTCTPTASSCARRRCGWASSADFVPGAEDRTANLLEARELDYVVGSVHFIGDVAVDHDRYDAWGRARSRCRLAALLRDRRRGGALGSVRHPRPPRSGQGLGPGAPLARPRSALLLRARDRGDRGVGDRGRDLDRGACASRSARSTRRRRSRRCAWRPEPISPFPRMPTAPPRSATGTSRRWSCSAISASTELCVFEGRQRRLATLGAEVGENLDR